MTREDRPNVRSDAMTREELVEKVALDIRNASCLTPTYPFKVFDPNEAEANIREWCKYAALAAIAVVLEEAAKVAGAAWIDHHFGEIADADLMSGLCEDIERRIRALGAIEASNELSETRLDEGQARSRSDER